MKSPETTDLSAAEVHWLRRRRAGLGQARWATDRGVSVKRLRAEEQGLAAAPAVPALPTLTEGEWCALQRRRRGWTMPEAAAQIGISRMTLWKAEHDLTAGVGAVRAFYVLQGVLQASATPPSAEPEPLEAPV